MRGRPGAGFGIRQRLVDGLMHTWWQAQPTLLARALQPASALYGAVAGRRRLALEAEPPPALPVPVLVVGNVVAGGAGKTPTVIALVSAFQALGRRPGVISRGYGRAPRTVAEATRAVQVGDDPTVVGDEPLLIARRTGAPVWVGRDRVAAAQALCGAEPQVDLLISDDGLQHRRLARSAELIVFDDRGAGNGLLLPAGPLREPMLREPSAKQQVLYTGTRTSTALPGRVAQRTAAHAQPLADWRGAGAAAVDASSGSVHLKSLADRRLLAVAGLADPNKFFDMLLAAGLQIDRLPLPDHHPYPELPWPAETTDVITTEKDAVKLDPARLPALNNPVLRVWVVPLDLQLPSGLLAALSLLLFPR